MGETKHGYTATDLELLFSHLNKLNLPDFTGSLNTLLGSYLAGADSITGEELTGVSNLFQFIQMLMKINHLS